MPPSEPVSISLSASKPSSGDSTPESAVLERYSRAAQAAEPSLCCPINYRPEFLKVIPEEVIERDYGCGDPSRYVREGETVLDLGSGGGKICFIAAQVVGPSGRVIGVDMNDEMLDLARRNQPLVTERIGYDNIRFLKGKIQDLAIDRDALDGFLREHPIASEADFQRLETRVHALRQSAPMIADESVDVVVSNCVLNLVDAADKEDLFDEIFRVLKSGGRAVISDIVSDAPVSEEMRRDPELWSGCISGAFQESEFLLRFLEAGFVGIEIAEFTAEPWQVVEGIEFRSMTVIAHKPMADEEDDAEEIQAECPVIYRGPFAAVMDDEGQEFARGQRVAVTEAKARALALPPYGEHFVAVDGEAPAPHAHGDSCGPGCC